MKKIVFYCLVMNLMNAFFGPSLLFMEDIEAKVSPKELILHYSFDKDSIKKKRYHRSLRKQKQWSYQR